jgi:hypothetical protein
MIKLFGFVKARGGQPARLVRVEATDRMPREELRKKLMAISARKQRAGGRAHTTGKARDEQPPSRSVVGGQWPVVSSSSSLG